MNTERTTMHDSMTASAGSSPLARADDLAASIALHARPTAHLVVRADPSLRVYGSPDSFVDLPLLVLRYSICPQQLGIFFVLRLGGRLRKSLHVKRQIFKRAGVTYS